MTVSIKAGVSNGSGVIQVDGLDRLIINSDGTLSTAVPAASGDSSNRLVTTAQMIAALSGVVVGGALQVPSVIITDSAGTPKFQLSYNATTDSLDTVKL